MRIQRIPLYSILALMLAMVLAAATVPPAYAVDKEVIQLQTMVQSLQQQMARMQQSFDERMGVMRSLVEQSTDNINKVTTAVDGVNRSLREQQQDAGGRSEQLSVQIQSLHDSVDELKARLSRVTEQLEEIKTAQTNLPAVSALPVEGGVPGEPAQPAAPPADVLYNNALRDYTAGKYDLAMQEFTDYLKYYPTTELAGNSQFYLADILYKQGDYKGSIAAYNVVLERYPDGNKTPAAQLKKAYAFLEMGQRTEGVRELNSLVTRYPRSLEAQQARERLKRLGPATTRAPRG
ncbi:MAG: tol-pal system protein YbgF [Candidatus Korobacteraceae bacterium]